MGHTMSIYVLGINMYVDTPYMMEGHGDTVNTVMGDNSIFNVAVVL